MAWPVALFWLSGATTYTLAILDIALASSIIPSAYIPSSLVINIFINFLLHYIIYIAIIIKAYQFF